jgi:hypothetical protein
MVLKQFVVSLSTFVKILIFNGCDDGIKDFHLIIWDL